LLRDLNQKKMPHPPFHMEKECGAKVWKLKLIIILQTKIFPKKNPPILSNREDGWAIDCKLR
jgi:hypothetical protein